MSKIKYCPKCNDEIYPDISGDYFCMDCYYAFISSSGSPKLPIKQWVKFKMG